MAVWTISAQEGTNGPRIAAELATAAGVSLLDRESLAVMAHAAEPTLPQLDEIESRFGRFTMLSLSTAISVGSAEACQEVELRHRLPDLGRAVLGEAARSPCVIYVPAAFAALQDHPTAIHVRLRAPLECRLVAYQREHLVDRRAAEKALKREDNRRQAWVRSLYRADIDDPRRFSIVLDASHFSCDRIVETLLAAGGVHTELAAVYAR
jgi:hypothetical protein